MSEVATLETAGSVEDVAPEHAPATPNKIKVYVALPTYANTMRRDFVLSLLDCLIYQKQLFPDVEFIFGTMGGDGIARTRNNLAQNFLLSTDCGLILFIDVDIVYTAQHIRRLIDVLINNEKLYIVGGQYPAKTLNHRWIMTAIPGVEADPETGLQEVQESGTGMKLVKREVFEQMMLAYPEIQYFCDGDTKGIVKWDFFSMGVVEGRYLSEDYYFDRRARQIGFSIYVDTKCQLKHQGHVDFPIPANSPILDGMPMEKIAALAESMECFIVRDGDGLRTRGI